MPHVSACRHFADKMTSARNAIGHDGCWCSRKIDNSYADFIFAEGNGIVGYMGHSAYPEKD